MLYCQRGMTTGGINMSEKRTIPGLGFVTSGVGLVVREGCSDGRRQNGVGGVRQILATGDGKVEFIIFDEHAIAYVNSAMGYPAYCPVPEVRLDTPVKAVLIDLDGTTTPQTLAGSGSWRRPPPACWRIRPLSLRTRTFPLSLVIRFRSTCTTASGSIARISRWKKRGAGTSSTPTTR